MRFLFLFALGLGCGTLALVAADSTAPSLTTNAELLQQLRPGHPRLLFTDQDQAEAVAAAKSDPVRAALHARIIEVAHQQLDEPAIEHRLIGPRMLDQSRLAISHILTAAMAFRLTGEMRYADFAKRDMLVAANFPDWNPSHFLDVAELSFALAIGYDWLYAQLSPAERATIKKALLERALIFTPSAYTPGGSPDKRLWFATATHNWNQVCNGGLLAAALAVADEQPALAGVVLNGVRTSLPRAMAAYQPDGAYPEGPSYWDYGTTYNVIALALLEGVLGTDFGLGKAPGFDRTALYRLHVQSPAGLAFNYADGGPNLGAGAEYSWLAQRYHHPEALAHSRALLEASLAKHPNVTRNHDRFLALQAVWFPRAPEHADELLEKTPRAVVFHGPAELAIMRGAWNDPRALWVGVKGGSNQVNHAHLDLGSFVLDALGVRWAEDLGPDDYNLPDYFGSKRWTYFRVNNRSHNTLTANDALQVVTATAPITTFRSTPQRSFVIVDLTAAYPGVAKKLQRGVAMIDDSRVLVQDEATGLVNGTSLVWRMFTEASYSLNARTHLRLQVGNKTMLVDLLEPADATFRVSAARPPTLAEKPNPKTLEISVEVSHGPSDAKIAVLLSPIGVLERPYVPGARVTPVPFSGNPNVRPLAEWENLAARD